MKKHGFLHCAFVLLVFSGCARLSHDQQELTQTQKDELAQHVISIDSEGKLNKCSSETDEKEYAICQDDYFTRITSGIETFKKKHGGKDAEVLFFVHGGLSDEAGALDRAERTYRTIRDNQQHPMYPIFVIWNSEAWSTYRDHLAYIRQGEKSSLAKYTWPIYLLTDLGNSIINAPKAWVVTGEHLWKSTRDNIGDKTKLIEDQLCVLKEKYNIAYTPTEDDKKKVSGIQRWIGNPNKSSRSLGWFATSPAKAVTTPFVYTLAKPAWDVMLRRTDTLFYTPCKDLKDEYACKKHNEVPPQEAAKKGVPPTELNPGTGALSVFIEQLKSVGDIKITLVGHSMGAIVVDKIILLQPELPYKNIVHLASADSVNHIFDIIVPYLDYSRQKEKCDDRVANNSNACGVQFYSLMLHPDNEDREMKYWGSIPSGSLLTWIDDMYTTPETVLDRRSGRWDNIRKVIPLIPQKVAKNMHFKIFGTDSKQDEKRCDDSKDCPPCQITGPQQHGDFDEMCFWEEATWK